ncbi:GntR family transcriptional regulator [Enterococcus hirae]|nr:GntR family transcriptional regulator [Enterococcus hirae]
MEFKSNLQIQAYKLIRQQIIYADLYPGKKVSEKILEESLRIGRTPIREALILLRQQGLVNTIPQSGNYISLIDLNSAKNARFVRENLERQIMIECCTKIEDQKRKILETLLFEQKKAIYNKDSRDFFHNDNLFHKVCYEIAGREEIWQWLEMQNTHLERFRWLRLKTEELKWEKIIEQHYQLFDALINKNPEEVDFLTSTHLHLMLDEQNTILATHPKYFN